MNNKKLMFFLMIFFFILEFVIYQKIKAKETTSVLTDADCIKCHPSKVSQIKTEGGKHAKVKCIDCHKGHPPLVPKEKVIPSCSECHKGKPHYTLSNCIGCHVNPHTPLKIVLKGKKLKKECLSCHSKVGKEMEEHPSKHEKLACTYCHIKHGYIPDCLKCHKPHFAGQKFEDCIKCHPAHKPTYITYGLDVPNSYCGACHKDIQKILESGKTKHALLNCAFCHRGRHRIIPQCEACHGIPHPQSMVRQYKGCLGCHGDPHNLIK